ncbi:MAG: DUF3604 domain-containing protein, partial [Deltaproteobacteria bacterium]|nr:DUF3604 domain-containing protein [Deltaproteobacteria bacterium]
MAGLTTLLAFTILVLPGSTLADVQAELIEEPAPASTGCADSSPLRKAYFGDLHVHTVFSLDASTQGTRNRPADAYRFARGERVGLQPYDAAGNPLRSAQLDRPLDFAAVTDHAELLGEWNICNTPGLAGHDSMVCKIYRKWPRAAFFYMNAQAAQANRHDFCGPNAKNCLDAARAPWNEIREAADAANDTSSDCSFTAFQAYEWTGAAGAGNNFHRNVIDVKAVRATLTLSDMDEPEVQVLWETLLNQCRNADTGCDAVIIPHNSNLSDGKMFRTTQEDGSPISLGEITARAAMEPLVEIVQHKGDSECAMGLGTQDELCNFEKLPYSNFSGKYIRFELKPPIGRQFIRNILKEGLRIEAERGVNPFKFGIMASTDTHLGTPGLVAEDGAYPGHGGAGDPSAVELPKGLPDAIEFNPGGLAVAWAEENSRDSLFAALQRREVYGTSGPRITLRFFGGWDYPADACSKPDFVEMGYRQGVPMGGDLTSPSSSTQAPTFAVSALRDPGAGSASGTPLQRIQIIKGWQDGDELKEEVFEVAGNPSNGAHVDLNSCKPQGEGHDSLCSTWTDPKFDPSQSAFYYARVVENPTCRWSQKVCVANRVRCDDPSSVKKEFKSCCAPTHKKTIQERAWSSPIWVRPSNQTPEIAN